jgi:hypothetical protein
MKTTLENIRYNKNHHYKLLLENISKYIYREKRYKIHFSLVMICHQEDFEIDFNKLTNELRESDTLMKINDQLSCLILDNTSIENYVKAAENLTKTLQKLYFKQHFYISTISSQEINHNYLEMSNKLFERLEYSIKNKQYNNVIYQDYII